MTPPTTISATKLNRVVDRTIRDLDMQMLSVDTTVDPDVLPSLNLEEEPATKTCHMAKSNIN